MDHEILRCTDCKVVIKTNYHMCDEVEGQWCPSCFDHTPCGAGDHGESCETAVFACEGL